MILRSLEDFEPAPGSCADCYFSRQYGTCGRRLINEDLELLVEQVHRKFSYACGNMPNTCYQLKKNSL